MPTRASFTKPVEYEELAAKARSSGVCGKGENQRINSGCVASAFCSLTLSFNQILMQQAEYLVDLFESVQIHHDHR